MDTDVLVIGTGLSGLVAATQAARAGARVVLLDQEGEQDLGGQAYWSFGGLFLIDSPEQRRMGIRDSFELARADWMGSAGFEEHDVWPRRWAEAYLDFAHGEKRAWLHAMGHRFFPVVGWAERGDGTADGHGNSVPRFHTSPGAPAPASSRRSSPAPRSSSAPAGCRSASATGSTHSSPGPVPSPACAARCSPPMTARAASPRTGRSPGSSSCGPARRSSPRAGSARTTRSCGRTGRPTSALPRAP
ncbi:FAD-binding protein [Brevibacterium sp. CS2]|nr:FAD-binding protein [Brevibacterium sp. CS2]